MRRSQHERERIDKRAEEIKATISSENVNSQKGKKSRKNTSAFTATDDFIAELVYDPEKATTQFAVYNRATFSISYKDKVKVRGQDIFPKNDQLTKDKGIMLPSKVEEYGSESDLIKEIRSLIHKYLDLDPVFEEFATYYAPFTWLYDNFDVTPYLRFRGDYGMGKSTALKVIGSICYKPVMCAGAITSAPIFRVINDYHGTLVIDEADFKNSDTYEDIIKIINAGNRREGNILRTVGEEHIVQSFNCYSPKLLATREDWKDQALESRCITIDMKGRKRKDIPLNIDHREFDPEVLAIRNKLLFWRLKNYGKHTINKDLEDQSIEDRLNQIMMPLKSIIQDKVVLQKFTEFMQRYNKRLIADRGFTKEAEALEAIANLWVSDKEVITMANIADRYNELFPNNDYKDGKINPRAMGHIVRKKLKLETKRTRTGIVLDANADDIDRLKVKYGLNEIQDKA